MSERQELLRERLMGLGFDVVRFARLDPLTNAATALREWHSEERHAAMEWMARTEEKRCDPGKVLEGARGAILLGINYWPGDSASDGRPAWAKYATYQDYHDTLRPGLEAAGRMIEEVFEVGPDAYRYYADTGPVLERAWAERAGLGFLGRNAMLISRKYGNWLFLAEILTRVDLVPDPPEQDVRGRGDDRVGLHCGTCTRCIEACPTSAIVAPGVVDARLCISYHTIENKGIIPRHLRAAFGNRVYGCDTCLDVCPWNRFAQKARSVLLNPRLSLTQLGLAELLDLTPERFAELFRGTPIKRTRLSGLLRNACVVAGNSANRVYLQALLRLAGHSSAVVRAHAVWAVYRLLDTGEAVEALSPIRAGETDPVVLAEYAAEQVIDQGAGTPPG